MNEELQNIIILNDHAYINGGSAKVAIESAIELSKRGYNVVFFAACGPIDGHLAMSNVEIVCLNQRDILDDPNRARAVVCGIWNGTSAKQLEILLNNYQKHNTVVHVHSWSKALSPSIHKSISSSGFAHIYTMHEYSLACPNGGFYNYKKQTTCELRALSLSCLTTNCDSRNVMHKGWRSIRQLVARNYAGLPSTINNLIYLSSLEQRLMEPYISATSSTHQVFNPITNKDSARVPAENNELILYIGRLSPEKGLMNLAEAALIANKTLVLVGEGEHRKLLEERYPNIHITGWLEPPQVESWLERARMLVMPSLWHETFGLVVAESISRGVPAICGEWNAASEIIRNYDGGRVIKDCSPNSIIAAINEIELDTANISKSCHSKYWASPLSMERHIHDLTNLYKQTLGNQI